jgi:hypothetical protein
MDEVSVRSDENRGSKVPARACDGAMEVPSPVFALKGRKSDRGVTNVRNIASPSCREG